VHQVRLVLLVTPVHPATLASPGLEFLVTLEFLVILVFLVILAIQAKADIQVIPAPAFLDIQDIQVIPAPAFLDIQDIQDIQDILVIRDGLA
jgi:hypothetical protein